MDPTLKEARKRVSKDLLRLDDALRLHQAFLEPPNPIIHRPVQVKRLSLEDANLILQREDALRLLWTYYQQFLRQNTDRDPSDNMLPNNDPGRRRFFAACYELWTFNYRYYHRTTIVSQIRDELPILHSKTAWVHALGLKSSTALHDLREVMFFLGALIAELWNQLPETVIQSAGEPAKAWAQASVIAYGPDLVVWLIKKDPLIRRDFQIGHCYLQGRTLRDYVEDTIRAEAEAAQQDEADDV
ncbi:MAG: hypothetical protein M1817_003251 [Caeruleum heppii]|nr:MAG: hypothetical protein M1817_003251 [Caeruleum heppii]